MAESSGNEGNWSSPAARNQAPRNIHPSQISRPEHQYQSLDARYDLESDHFLSGSPQSIKHKLGSFVGSYSRTSMMFMAENLSVPITATRHLEDDADFDTRSTMSFLSRWDSRRDTAPQIDIERRSSAGSFGAGEYTPLLLPKLDKVPTISITSIAEDYQFDPHSIQGSAQKSSYLQSVFNSINILIGIGILSLPLGFKCAGWAVGGTVFIFCCGLTMYTAKLLSRCLSCGENARTYGDMGDAAFGLHGRVLVSMLFLTELITSSVALVVLLGDGIQSLFPGYDTLTVRGISWLVVTPMLFLPVRQLSYTSLFGIVSAGALLVIMLFDGLTKQEAPGSLLEPADTTLWPESWSTVPLSFGLIMAGFAGHAVLPSVHHDMDEPKHYNKMVNTTYVIVTAVYALMASAGYAMFGSYTMEEITQNLSSTPGYNQALNRFAVILIALNPIAKYALTLNPVNLTWEIWLFSNDKVDYFCGGDKRKVIKFIGKLLVSTLVVTLAYLIPGFDKVMALLGAFFSVTISGSFPLLCHMKLFHDTMPKWEMALNIVLFIISMAMAILGTAWSFL
ncbi:hypothetical protein INT43_007901 [Umbelopsis isabellina]|uniref:Amino acid transporter transmembrane domain-containing protein n=1 Tax=Mortierella isabellina TaxID=91625 RepID=A0A8H7PPM2_MORIS|nr:hypothetical protein INT43_007901 [Umbelopsis isabellina]